jgi:hypothetical protein
VRAGPSGHLPGARSAVTVPRKRAAARSGWDRRLLRTGARERSSAEVWSGSAGLQHSARPGWDLQEAKRLLFFFFFFTAGSGYF